MQQRYLLKDLPWLHLPDGFKDCMHGHTGGAKETEAGSTSTCRTTAHNQGQAQQSMPEPHLVVQVAVLDPGAAIGQPVRRQQARVHQHVAGRAVGRKGVIIVH